jgi:hypothetical protein
VEAQPLQRQRRRGALMVLPGSCGGATGFFVPECVRVSRAAEMAIETDAVRQLHMTIINCRVLVLVSPVVFLDVWSSTCLPLVYPY